MILSLQLTNTPYLSHHDLFTFGCALPYRLIKASPILSTTTIYFKESLPSIEEEPFFSSRKAFPLFKEGVSSTAVYNYLTMRKLSLSYRNNR